MDPAKIGKFIAALRRQKGLTQESLGERLGVTNKTISRWENGNYMPDIEMFQLLSQEFGVSIHELLSGQRLSDEEFRRKADENVIGLQKEGLFSFEDRKAYFQKKWRTEHIGLFILLGCLLLASIVVPPMLHRPWLVGFAPLIGLVEYAWQNNKMMIYVEHKLYD